MRLASRFRPPSFSNLQALDEMIRGHMVTDREAIMGTLDILSGQVGC